MGIRGLMTYCMERRHECAEKVNLIDVASQRNGIELLIDFYSFSQLIVRKFWKGLQQLRHNEYLRIVGGEYDSLHKFVSKLVTDLKSLGISPVFFIDGSKGSSPETTRQKLNTWMKRHKQDVDKLLEIMNVCCGRQSIADLSEHTSVRPVVLETQLMNSLKSCNCEVFQCVSGEADYVIAQALLEREKAYAVLSNDSDFCIFRGCRFIPNDLFDLHNDLCLGQPVSLPDKPLRLDCEVILSEKVASIFGFADQSLLVEMSIIGGNDFTGPVLTATELSQKLKIQGGKSYLENVAAWTKKYNQVENHPAFAKEMNHNWQLKSAVEHSRRFYNVCEDPSESLGEKGFVRTLVEERVKKGVYPANIMGIHNGFYWHRMLIEDAGFERPCIEVTLCDLRAFIYRLVLPKHKYSVSEHGRTPWEIFKVTEVLAVEDRTVPPVNYIHENQIFRNLRHFDYIMSHQEPGAFKKTWFDRYGRKNGFICYILRYFLVLNWGRNLQVSETEFLALVALVFGKCEEGRYQEINIRPSPRCVTLINWLQDIYRHAYEFLGKLLFLCHEFPLPRELFSGAVWTAFFNCRDEAWYAASQQVPAEYLHRARQEMDGIIHEKRHMLRYLTEGIFYFDDRY